MENILDILKSGNDVLVSDWFAWCPVLPGVSLVKAGGGNDEDEDWDVNGQVARVDKADFDDQILHKAGVLEGMSKFFADYGHHIDWEHKYPETKDAKWLIGTGTKFADVGGMPHLTSRLYKSQEQARIVRNLIHIEKASIGYSIWGTGVRDKANPKRIAANDIRMVTLATSPKGFNDTRVKAGRAGSLAAVAKALTLSCDANGNCRWAPVDAVTLHKALTTGSGIVPDGATGGMALRAQELVSPGTVGKKTCGCGKKHDDEEGEEAQFQKSLVFELRRQGVTGDLVAMAAAAAKVRSQHGR